MSLRSKAFLVFSPAFLAVVTAFLFSSGCGVSIRTLRTLGLNATTTTTNNLVGTGIVGPSPIQWYDAAGSLYFADSGSHVIRKVTAGGTISTVAGNNGIGAGYSGDGGLATSAQLNFPAGVAFDALGNYYISDQYNAVIRKVDGTTGIITTVAGNNALGNGYSGDGGPATSAQLSYPAGIAVDAVGNLIIADQFNGVIRMVNASTGKISTIAGDQTLAWTYSGDGGPAISAALAYPQSIAIDSAGNLFITDGGNNVIRRVDISTGVITTVAGDHALGGGYSGDSGPATSAQIAGAFGISVDAFDNLFIADANSVIRKVDMSTGIIATIAGDNSIAQSYAGDGGPATSAGLFYPQAVSFDAGGNMIIMDSRNHVVRKVNGGGTISTIAGNNALALGPYNGDGYPAEIGRLQTPRGLHYDAGGNLYIVDMANEVVRKVNGAGIISTFAGNNALGAGFSGDGAAATAAQLNDPRGVTADGAGNIYIADTQNCVIRKVTPGGTISTFAGDGVLGAGYAGDGGAATSAQLNQPSSVAFDGAGNLYIADTINSVIRKVTPGGIISTVAGDNTLGGGYSGDGGAATAAALYWPEGVTVDGVGNLYIADTMNHVVRKVTVGGIISTVAGNHALAAGYTGDGGPATSAQLSTPGSVVVDGAGNLYIADGNFVIRKVDTLGTITTFAGVTAPDYWGDYGPATSAHFGTVKDLTFDSSGNLVFTDSTNNAVRKIDTSTGIITPVAGRGYYYGNGIPATNAVMSFPDFSYD